MIKQQWKGKEKLKASNMVNKRWWMSNSQRTKKGN